MLAWIALFSCISSFLFGYDLGLVGGALLHIQSDLGVGDAAASAIVGAAKLGAVAGTFLGAALMLYWGRRPAIAVDSVFFTLGPLIMAASWGAAALVVGRVMLGLGIGVSAVVVPAFLGEVAPAGVRGRIVELYELMLCFGMLAAALANAALEHAPGSWRWMVGIPAVPALLMALAICLLPESPRWLVTQGRLDDALAVIHRVYTSSALPRGAQGSTAEVEAELMELWSAVEKDKAAAAERRQRHEQGIARRRQKQQQAQQQQQQQGDRLQGWMPAPGLRPDHPAMSPHLAAPGVAPAAAASSDGGSGGGGGVVGVPPRLPRIRTSSADRLDLLGEGEAAANGAADRRSGSQREAGGSGQSGEHAEHGSPTPTGPYPSPVLTRATSDTPWTAQWQGDGGGSGPGRGGGFWSTAWDMLLDIYIVARGPERGALRMALALAFFNQAFASTAIINYAPSVLRHAGVESGAAASLFTSLIGAAKLAGVGAAFFLVDSVGRQPLLLWGSLGCSASLALLVPADWADSHWLLLAGMCAFILCFSMSWAGVFWVLLSEIFSMGAKSPAVAAATATLFLTGAAADLLFLAMHAALGPFVFLLYSLIAAAAAAYVFAAVPETKGKTLLEVQALLAVGTRGGQRGEDGEREGLVPAGSVHSVEMPPQAAGRWP